MEDDLPDIAAIHTGLDLVMFEDGEVVEALFVKVCSCGCERVLAMIAEYKGKYFVVDCTEFESAVVH